MFSRRRFLQLVGITTVTASISLPISADAAPDAALDAASLSTPAAAPALETVYGRAFRMVRVYVAPSTDSPIRTRLWTDSISPILDAHGDWYRLPNGYALREQMQPMIAPAQHSDTTFRPPFWAEVSGAVGIVHVACDAFSKVVQHIGHGGVLRVIDWLPAESQDGIDWYGVTDRTDGLRIGWTQKSAWSPVQPETISPTLTVLADINEQYLTVRDGDHILLTAPMSTGSDLRPGVYPIIERNILETGDYNSLKSSWLLHFGDDLTLSGVYWHNRFGRTSPGAALQVTPPLARWLYSRAESVIIS